MPSETKRIHDPATCLDLVFPAHSAHMPLCLWEEEGYTWLPGLGHLLYMCSCCQFLSQPQYLLVEERRLLAEERRPRPLIISGDPPLLVVYSSLDVDRGTPFRYGGGTSLPVLAPVAKLGSENTMSE